eukprot:s178_g54.t1
MINDFLGITGQIEETTSHSLKATTLAWCARYGIGDTSRAMLGHHALALYSRDLLARPLRELCGMLLDVRQEHFQPDGTRSGYMKETRSEPLVVPAAPAESLCPSRAGVSQERERRRTMAAMNLTDSAAAFERHAKQLGLHDEYLDGLKTAGVTTLPRLAVSCGQQGAPATEANIRQMLPDSAPSRAITVGDVAVMRRLVFEAQTSVVAQPSALADPAADPTQNKLPQAERMARIAEQKKRMSGLRLEGPMEVTVCTTPTSGMMQADALKYLNPAKCIPRMQEITMTKPPKELRLDASGQGIMVKDVQNEQHCSVSTELDVMEAMTRRSLAFDLVGLIDFETFQKWIQHLFQIMRKPAPPGFRQPHITQLLRANRQAFVRMQEMTREGIQQPDHWMRPRRACRRTAL